MEAVTRRLADGDYSAHTDIARRDEIGSLAAHIDTLALRLDEAFRESARLEQRCAKTTSSTSPTSCARR